MRYLMPPEALPSAWFNVTARLAEPLSPPLHPASGDPVTPDDLAPLFPTSSIDQEMSTQTWIDIPGRVIDVLRLWRPTPLVRARRLEQTLDTPARIYFKDESVSPAGSHMCNIAVAQAYYNSTEGVRRIASETGAGQWVVPWRWPVSSLDWSARSTWSASSYRQKPYRRVLMETWGTGWSPSTPNSPPPRSKGVSQHDRTSQGRASTTGIRASRRQTPAGQTGLRPRHTVLGHHASGARPSHRKAGSVMRDRADENGATRATARYVDPEIAQRFLRDVMPLHDQLQRVARRLTRNRADAEDLVQDTLVRALTGFAGYEPGNLRAWLMTIMTNTAISTHRRRQLRPTEVLTADISESTPGVRHGPPSHWRSPEMSLMDSMPSDHTLTALRRLPEAGQEVLYYADVEGLPYSEIADILGVPLGTVMSRVHRARQRLRHLLTAAQEQRASAEPDLSCKAPRVA